MKASRTTTFRPTAQRSVLLILGGLTFVALGLWFLVAGDDLSDRIAGFLSVAFFGPCAAILLARRLRARPELVVSDDGLEHVLYGRVGWDEVAYVAPIAFKAGHVRHHMVQVGLRDPGAYLARQSPAKRALSKANAALGYEAFLVPTVALAEGPADVIAAMLDHNPYLTVLHPADRDGA